ncbi:hypothetical protein F5X96DRAFT_273692 [Biscogniauxia mediterranea]|nr:hypothetical protein F5X96DRAFT_273692 [Biscogniauxia mediterranea]
MTMLSYLHILFCTGIISRSALPLERYNDVQGLIRRIWCDVSIFSTQWRISPIQGQGLGWVFLLLPFFFSRVLKHISSNGGPGIFFLSFLSFCTGIVAYR